MSILGIEYGDRLAGAVASVTDDLVLSKAVTSGGLDEYMPAQPGFFGDAEARPERVVCGNPECSRRWLTALKSRRRPIFERQWGCGATCIEAMVAAALRREGGGDDVAEGDGRHRHRVPLGLVLLSQGWITHPQLRHALESQRRAGRGRIGRWLIDEFGLKEEHVTRALSVQWSCPVLPMEGFDPAAMALTVPRVLVERLGLVPVRIAGERTLYLAFEDHVDASAAFAMERMNGLKVQSGVAGGTQLRRARERLLASEFVDAKLEQAADADAIRGKIASAIWKLQPKASRVVRVHGFYWLRMWLESGAMRREDGGFPATKEDVVDRMYEVTAGS